MTPRPKSTKAKYHVAIEPHTMDRLKALAKKQRQPIGDTIEGLLDFTEMDKFITDERIKKLFQGLLGTALANAGESQGEWIPEGVDVLAFAKQREKERRERKRSELLAELDALGE